MCLIGTCYLFYNWMQGWQEKKNSRTNIWNIYCPCFLILQESGFLMPCNTEEGTKTWSLMLSKKTTFCSCDCPVQTLPSDFQADTMSSLKDVICQSIPGHQGLKSSTNWPRTLEETLFPARTWSWSLYRPMTASAGLRMVKFRQRGSLGSWVALQPLAPSSERVNMALVCWDSSGDGPARENGWTGGGGLWEEEMNYVWGPEWR